MKNIKRFSLIALIIILGVSSISIPMSGAFAKGKAPITGVLNINIASMEELTQLPGIGQSKAEAIIAYRQTHPFKDVSELTEVKGIGPKMLEKLQTYLIVEGPTTLKQASSNIQPAMAASQK